MPRKPTRRGIRRRAPRHRTGGTVYQSDRALDAHHASTDTAPERGDHNTLQVFESIDEMFADLDAGRSEP